MQAYLIINKTPYSMSGLTKQTPIPTEIKLHQKSRLLELAYEDGSRYQLTHEFLRVFTPSAEAQGHGPGQETLQVGKRDVEIVNIEPAIIARNIAITITFKITFFLFILVSFQKTN